MSFWDNPLEFIGNQIHDMNQGKADLVDLTAKSLGKATDFFGKQLRDMQNGKSALVDRIAGTDYGPLWPDDDFPDKPASPVVSYGDGGVSVAMPDYLYADLAKAYGMDATTAYQEALSNTSYRRAMDDLKAAGLNPILATGHGASGVSYATPLEQSSTVASFSRSGLNTGTNSGKSLHFWYKNLTSIGTIIGAVKGHPIIGASVGGSIGNLLDMFFD